MSLHTRQRTIARPVDFTGQGVHSGKQAQMTVKPAPLNHGIKFVRADLPGAPEIPAHFNRVVDTSLATVIGAGGVIVSTIEHLMATFAGLSIDNALVLLDSYEVPIMDGSAGPFARELRRAGFREQPGSRCFFRVTEPIELVDGDRRVAIYPDSEFRITCEIEFKHPLVGRQILSISPETDFEREISWARTFGFLHEVEYLKRHGFARGGSLDNAVVLTADGVMNEGGLRYPDEFARHKILDCVGDFALLGMPLMGHLKVTRSGHQLNHAFLEKFFASKSSWETHTVFDAPAASEPTDRSQNRSVKDRPEQLRPEQLRPERLQSERLGPKQLRPKQLRSEQVQSEQIEPERDRLEERRRAWAI